MNALLSFLLFLFVASTVIQISEQHIERKLKQEQSDSTEVKPINNIKSCKNYK